jgi:hypothetical protein
VAPPLAPALTRRRLIAGAALGGLGLAAGAVYLGELPRVAAKASPEQDVEILNFALGLERLQAAYYAEALRAGVATGELEGFAQVVAEHEQAHVDFLLQALGNQAAPEAEIGFGDSLADERAFTRTAIVLEDAAVAAYNGQITNLTVPAQRAAARIVSVDARHAAWIRAIVGILPAEQGTDPGRPPGRVNAAIARTGIQV